MIDRAFVPKLAKKARLKHDRHSGGYMLMYPERGLALNESAAEIAKRCDGSKSIDAIATELAEAHGANRDSIAADVIAFVEGLWKKGLLEVA